MARRIYCGPINDDDAVHVLSLEQVDDEVHLQVDGITVLWLQVSYDNKIVLYLENELPASKFVVDHRGELIPN